MSDSKFINTYIDVIIGTLHENLNTVLQLKTQQKLVNDLIQEKDEVISSLQNQITTLSQSDESNKYAKDNLSNEIEELRKNAKIWEDSYNAMKNKISHMDTLTNQLNQYKQDIISKNNEIESLKTEIANLKSKKALKETVKAPVVEEINSKSKTVKKEEIIVPKTKTLDDF